MGSAGSRRAGDVVIEHAVAPRPRRVPRLAHQPALDGVRGVAVVMVLLFHGGVSWMRGGYFGVSVFFTLSGFLITSLLLRELGTTGRISPVAFYLRRAKRLLPASTVCLVAVAWMGARGVWTGVDHLRRDADGALFQVANWVQLAAGRSYTDLQSKAAGVISPLDHYWSLSIEEQFYWLWPLVVFGVHRVARRRRGELLRPIGLLTVASAAAAPIIAAVWGRDAAYWATPARAGEILVGALLAVALIERPRLLTSAAAQRAASWCAPLGLSGVVVLGVVLPAAGGPAYHGAFPALALVSAALLFGLQHAGPITNALSSRPLTAIGAVSYGLYLYHFPVFVFLSTDRVGTDGWRLLVVRLAATAVIALVSYWVIERPIRRAEWRPARTLMHAAVALGVAVIAIAFVPQRDASYWRPSQEAVAAAEIPAGEGTVAPLLAATADASGPPTRAVAAPPTTAAPRAAASTTTTDAPSTSTSLPAADVATTAPVTVPLTVPEIPALNRPVRILVLGDSTAMATATGLIDWAGRHTDIAKVTSLAAPGCGFIRGGIPVDELDTDLTNNCNRILDVALPDALAQLHPDVVMLMTTIRDVEPRLFYEEEGPLTPADKRFVDRARVDYKAITDMILNTSSAHVVWVKPPLYDPYWKDVPQIPRDPLLHSVMEVLMGGMLNEDRNRVALFDMKAWLEQAGLEQDHALRPDGLHFDAAGALTVASRWLGPALVNEAVRLPPG